MKKLKKGIFCSDIHFGKKSNSEQHNQDCLDYLTWFCNQVKNIKDIDYIGFLGDWNENRSALNIATLNYSYQGAKMLNNLGLPVFFCIGNHDLYHRHTREIHSIIPFQEFSNFAIINEPTVFSDVEGKMLVCPYLFHDEYEQLLQYTNIPFWAGHFEFKGFIVTGYNIAMPTGPDHTLFKGPKYIASGHFHKRQYGGNVVYIGNCFPMDFGDIDDNQRGLMIYDHSKQKMSFMDWPECPKYIKTTLTALLDGKVIIPPNSRVKCVMDIPISFEESTSLKNELTETFNLREFVSEEAREVAEAISGTIINDKDNIIISSIDELIIQMLNSIDVANIDNDLLIEQYRKLK
jgi:DNA repair exonuclease SbcCD nuclease subunit